MFSKRNAHEEKNWTHNHMFDSAFCHQHYYFTLLSKKGLRGIECWPGKFNPVSDHFGALTICRRASTSFIVWPSKATAWCCLHDISADTALIRVSTAVAWRLIVSLEYCSSSVVFFVCYQLPITRTPATYACSRCILVNRHRVTCGTHTWAIIYKKR